MPKKPGCIREIDFLVGTFGKAAASAGAYIVCRRTIREYLVNRMRTLIFTTALPPVNIAWTLFIIRRLGGFRERRIHLENISNILREALKERECECPSASYIVPMIVGKSSETILKAEELQRHGFYCLTCTATYGSGGDIAYPLFADGGNKGGRSQEASKIY